MLSSGNQIVDISAGKNHILFLTKNGKVFSCGSNKYGQCGRYVDFKEREPGLSNVGRDTRLTEEIIPFNEPYCVKFPRNTKAITRIEAGGKHSLCMDDEGSVFCWGDDSSIQLGLGDTRSNAPDKRHAFGTHTFEKLGTISPGGENRNQVKYNYYVPHVQTTPVKMLLPEAVNRPDPYPAPDHLAAGEDFSIVHFFYTIFLFISSNICSFACKVGITDSPGWFEEDQTTNLMFCCGHNNLGQCGRNMQQQMQTFQPARLPRRSYADSISCGSGHCLARLKDGSIFGWGNNLQGQVGLGHKSPTEQAARIRLEPEDISAEELTPLPRKPLVHHQPQKTKLSQIYEKIFGEAEEQPTELFQPKKSKSPPCPGGKVMMKS